MTEKAYGKINLTLEVLKKINNYHEIESLVVPIDLHDTLTFQKAAKDELVSNIFIPNNNIVLALKLFKETYRIKEAVKITLTKRIPIGKGLGGSSADISATLRGLNRFFNVNKPLKELEKLAAKLGSDTVFCLYNKRAFIKGRGEKISFISPTNKLKFLLILPEISLSTKKVYQAFSLTNKSEYIGFSNMEEKELLNNLKNDLLSAALYLSPPLKQIYIKLKENNIKINLTGSGSALFIVNPTKDDLKRVKAVIKENVLLEFTNEI